ncbi:MAG TPA: oligosaccharide flippase family protein [Solirubrobacteraceae bacterium]|nr:oligosaccharide flippase family protein [Solirubrobacteraceae bacterium]
MPPAEREDAIAVDARTEAPAVEERVSRSAGFSLLAQMVGAVLTGALTIFLGRALSSSEFGDFTFAMSVVLLATLLADLGITPSSDRFVAERRARLPAAFAVFRTAFLLKAIVGVSASLALFLLAGPICEVFGTTGAVWALKGGAIALLGQSLFLLFLGTVTALGMLRYSLVLATVESIAEAIATVALVLLGAGASGAAFGRAIGYTVGVAGGIVVIGRIFGRARRAGRDSDHEPVPPRRILAYAGPLLAVDVAFRVFASIDVLLIAAIVSGGAAVAAFGLPMRFAAFLDYPAGAISAAVAPRMARRGSGDLWVLAQSIRYLIIVQMMSTVPLLVWSPALIHLLFGDKYPEAPAVLRALAPYVLLAGIAQPTTLAVNYLGQARRRVPIAIAMLGVNVVIDVTLLPRIGVLAAAIGTSAAYAIWVPAHVWLLRRDAGLRVRPILVTLGRTSVAGGVMVGVLALLGTGNVPIPLLLVGAVLGPLTYGLALFALGELTLADVELVRRVLARRAAA